MTKTPEQMAEEFFENWQPEKPKYIRPKARQYALEKVTECFLAGYQAAMNSPEKSDSCEHILDMEKMVDADKVKFCVYCNDTHKGNCAIGKGKNHPAFGFSEIVVKIESSWVSVKDRLPEDGVEVLVVSDGETGASWHEAGEFGWAIGGTVTHWAPLPKPPEEEK